MDLADYINKIRTFGLEYFSKYYGSYKGYVAYTNDPENLCRLRVCVPGIYGKNIPNYWALPKGMYSGNKSGFVALPKEGDPIWVSFENGDSRYPIWEYGWFIRDTLPEGAGVSKSVFQFGEHRLEFDEKEDQIKVINKAGYFLTLTKDGIDLGGKNATKESAVLGDTLEDLLENFTEKMSTLVEKLISTTAPPPTYALSTVADFTALKIELEALKLTIKEIKSTKVTLI